MWAFCGETQSNWRLGSQTSNYHLPFHGQVTERRLIILFFLHFTPCSDGHTSPHCSAIFYLIIPVCQSCWCLNFCTGRWLYGDSRKPNKARFLYLNLTSEWNKKKSEHELWMMVSRHPVLPKPVAQCTSSSAHSMPYWHRTEQKIQRLKTNSTDVYCFYPRNL